jgi:hypothetical protein
MSGKDEKQVPGRQEINPENSTYEGLEKKLQQLLEDKTGERGIKEILDACTEFEKIAKSLDNKLNEYNDILSTNTRGIWKGDIIGSNIIDRQVNIEEILGSEKDKEGNYIRVIGEGTDNEIIEKISAEQADEIQKSIDKWGPRLNLIAYERLESSRFFGLVENKGSYIVVCYDDQVLGLDDDGGNVTLLCPGTIRYGRFEIPTGYPGRLKVMISEIHCLPWKDLNKNLISGISEITNKALDANPGYSQAVTMADANKPITIKRGKDE